jgi:hypothetical protein
MGRRSAGVFEKSVGKAARLSAMVMAVFVAIESVLSFVVYTT